MPFRFQSKPAPFVPFTVFLLCGSCRCNVQVSVSTFVQAYTVLKNRGLIEARPQSGSGVRAQAGLRAPKTQIARPRAQPSAVGLSDLAADFMAYSTDPDYVPFGAAYPRCSLFLNKKLARILGAVGRGDPALLGRCAMNRSYPPLAREIARRDLQTDTPLPHDEIVITIDGTEALNLSLRAIPKPAETIAIESPAYFGVLQIISALGLKVIEIPTDSRNGINLPELQKACEKCELAALVVTPARPPRLA